MNKITSRHILVVDDQDNWREALTSLLSKEGYMVKTVKCFEDAVHEIEQNNFDLYVLDVRLVDTDVFNIQGLEILRFIKDRKKDAKVIILTGYPEIIRDKFLEKYNVEALLLKVPSGSRFNSKEFINQVQNLLHF